MEGAGWFVVDVGRFALGSDSIARPLQNIPE